MTSFSGWQKRNHKHHPLTWAPAWLLFRAFRRNIRQVLFVYLTHRMIKDGDEAENKCYDFEASKLGFATFKPCSSGKKNKSCRRVLGIRIFWCEAVLMGVHLPPCGRSSVLLFRVRHSSKGLKDVGPVALQHFGVYTPNNVASHLRRIDFLATQLWESEIHCVRRMSGLRVPQQCYGLLV